MKSFVRCAAITAAFLVAPAAIAETAAPAAAVELKAGGILTSSDGKRIGRIDRVLSAADGAPVSVSLIFDSRFVFVPASTITASANGFSTSLTRAEVRKLK